MSDDLVKRLRARASNERAIQANNEAVAAALKGQLLLFEQGVRSEANTFAVRLGLNHRDCAKHDAELAADWDEAADRIAAARAQCCMCGKTGLSTEEDGGPECEMEDGRWVCSRECWERSLPDAIAAAEAQGLRKAAEIAEDSAPVTQDWLGSEIADRCHSIAAAIRALIPAPPPADGGDT